MDATLLTLPVETPEPLISCDNCPAVQRLERALEQLRRDFHREVGYWKSQRAKALKRILPGQVEGLAQAGLRPGAPCTLLAVTGWSAPPLGAAERDEHKNGSRVHQLNP